MTVMSLLFWTLVFAVALFALVKGADWLLLGAGRVGLSLGLSPFIIGVTIVGIGTGLPEMISGIAAVVSGVTTIPVANAVGSNVANILLVIGILAIWSRHIDIKKSIVKADLPLLLGATVVFLFLVPNGHVSFLESTVLLGVYGAYLGYTVLTRKHVEEGEAKEAIPEEASRPPRWWQFWRYSEYITRPDVQTIDWLRIGFGMLGLGLGARYVVESVTELSGLLGIGAGVIALVAIAFGTSLPEVIVSVKAARQGQSEVALGNIIGSSIFNILAVVGAGGLFGELLIDGSTLALGIPFMAGVTLLFIVSSVSRRIYAWEGATYLVLYALFIGKTTGAL
jgi:cation:H+ antiporter